MTCSKRLLSLTPGKQHEETEISKLAVQDAVLTAMRDGLKCVLMTNQRIDCGSVYITADLGDAIFEASRHFKKDSQDEMVSFIHQSRLEYLALLDKHKGMLKTGVKGMMGEYGSGMKFISNDLWDVYGWNPFTGRWVAFGMPSGEFLRRFEGKPVTVNAEKLNKMRVR